MGFWETVLGPKYQRVSGISFLSLKAEPMAELPLVTKNLSYASDYNLDIVIPQIINHKSFYRRTITQKTVDKYNLQVETISTSEEDLTSFVANLDGRYPGNTYTLTENEIIEDVLPLTLGIPNTNTNVALQIISDQTGYNVIDLGVNNDIVDASGNNKAVININTLSVTNYELLMSFSYDNQVYDAVSDTWSSNGITTVTDHDVADFLCATVEVKDSNNVLSMVYVDRAFYTLGIYATGSILGAESYAPNFEFTDSPLTNKQRDRLLDIYGADIEALQNIEDNSNIETIRVGFMISPTTMQYHERIVKYFFDFLDKFPMPIQPYQAKLRKRMSIPYSVGDFEVKIKFLASKEISTGSFPKPADFKEWKVYIQQVPYDAELYTDDLIDLYETHISHINYSSNLLDPPSNKIMYDELYAYSISSPSSSAKTDLKSNLPPKEVTGNRRPRKIVHAFCQEANIAEALYDKLHDQDGEITHSILKYKEAKTNIKKDDSIYEDYFALRSKQGDYEKYDIYKRTGLNTYENITITWGQITYSDHNDTTAFISFKERNESFRVPLLYNDLSRLNGKAYSYKEFSIIYNNSLCAYAYSVTNQYIKWYQRSNVATIVITITTIIAIVVEVATAGVATPVVASVEAAVVSLVTVAIISFLLSYAGSLIGGDLGMLFQLVGAVVVAIYTGQIQDSTDLWMSLADGAIKFASYKFAEDTQRMAEEFDQFMKEMNKKNNYIESLLSGYKRSFDPQILVENMRNSDVGSLIGVTGDEVEKLMMEAIEKSWQQKEVKASRVADPYANIDIPNSVFDFSDGMYSFPQYGDESEFKI
jgi:hypothetical protein